MNELETLASQPVVTEAIKQVIVIAVGFLVVLLTAAWAFASLGEMQAERHRRRHLYRLTEASSVPVPFSPLPVNDGNDDEDHARYLLEPNADRAACQRGLVFFTEAGKTRQKFVLGTRVIFLAFIAVLGCLTPSHAWEDYGSVTLQVQVVDRTGKPVPGARVRFTAQLDGVAREETSSSGRTSGLLQSVQRVITTAADGVARTTISPPASRSAAPWFRGSVRFTAQTLTLHGRDVRPAGPVSVSGRFAVPQMPGGLPEAVPALRVWEAPDTLVDGFPLWLGRDKKADRIVVLVEGFDLYNGNSATDTLRLVGSAGDALRQVGIDLLVVNFADSHQAPDQLAPTVARAIRAASAATGGRSVAVAGLSAGGITARWTLVVAEEANAPLPVHTLIFMDTPNRGARMNPALQAMVQRYGKKADREALSSDAARALLTETITDVNRQVQWKRFGPPLAQRLLPVECQPTAQLHNAFYERLRQLNDHNGYPKHCRLVAVANSSRENKRGEEKLFRIWLPWGSGWTLRAAAEDTCPGSLLPRLFVNQFRVRYPLGLAGAYLPTAPTFLPAASALDAGPGETPPFHAWYARPNGLAPLAHDNVDPAAGRFVVRELLQSAWK